MKTALVCGAGGFIGGHLVARLKQDGYWVRGVDIKHHEFAPTQADEFLLLDLRERSSCRDALLRKPVFGNDTFDEVYQLAADMGGMGFIESSECGIMHNNALININMIDAATELGVARYFFSSSVCVYRDMLHDELILNERQAYPAQPDNEYGWEKLYAERIIQAYARHHPIQVRIARFENCYGPLGTWQGGREKAPAALCRKASQARDGESVEVWGDGTAVRSFIYVDDLLDAIEILMHSGERYPTNIGTEERVTVDYLAQLCIDASGKDLAIRHVPGPVGVESRNFSHKRMRNLGWEPRTSLREGIQTTYDWIEEQNEDCQHTHHGC